MNGHNPIKIFPAFLTDLVSVRQSRLKSLVCMSKGPRKEKVVRRGQMKRRQYLLVVVLTLIAGLLVVSGEACKNKSKIEVVPGKSIVGVEIGMTEEQVIGILGMPMQAFSPEELGMVGRLYTIPSNRDAPLRCSTRPV